MRVALLLFVLLATGVPVYAQSNAHAELHPAEIATGQTATLRITVRSAGSSVPDISAPRLPGGLTIVGTSQSTQISISGGARTSSLVREFMLHAAQPGEYTIPPVSVTIEGRTEQTEPLQLRVTGRAAAPTPATTDDARLTVELAPDTVYVGQQVTLTGELLVTPELQMRMTRPPGHEAPAPADFWLHELPPSRSARLRTIDGRRFVAQQFHRAYFPLLDGRFSFAPARVTFEAREGFFYAPREIELRSGSPRVVVLPLPTRGRPETFRGAVGQFTVEADLEPDSISAGDAVTLTLVVQGHGNIKALPAPVLPDLDGIDVLPPTEFAEVTVDGLRVGGKKTFSWVLVPTGQGRVVLPPIRYPVFDPERREYVVHQTDSLELQVLPASTTVRSAELAPVRTTRGGSGLNWVRSPAFLVAQLVPVAGVLLLLLRRRRRTPKPSAAGTDRLIRVLRSRIDAPDFAAEAERALLEIARSHAGEALPASIAVAELEARLSAAGDSATAGTVAALLQDIRALRYAPGSPDRSSRESVLSRLEALAHTTLQPTPHTALGIAPVLLLPLFLQVAADADAFAAGVNALEQKRSSAAIAAFEQHLSENSRDASAWYNLGHAHYQAEQRGSAVLAWLRAAQIEPRAPDIRTNLRAVGAGDLLARIQPPTMLSREESLLLAALFWWIALALPASALLLRKRMRPFLLAALAPLLLSGLVLTATAIPYALPPGAVIADRGAQLLDAPNRQSETLAPLPPGSGVVILERTDLWSRVRLANGVTGWVDSADLFVL